MTEPNGMTYMTDEERKILGTLKQHPTNILTLSHCPSEEFLLAAVFENIRILVTFAIAKKSILKLCFLNPNATPEASK